MKNRCIALILALFLAACSSAPTFQTGPDAEITHDGLTRLDGTIMDIVWARTDIDITSYSKIRLQPLGVEFRPVDGPYSGRAGTGSLTRGRSGQSEFQLDEATQQLFVEEISAAFREELADTEAYEIVDEPGPGVLNIYVGLLDIVSRVPPQTVGRSDVFIDRVGEATLVMELRDSTSNAILLRAVDRRAAERQGQAMRSNTATNRGEVRRLGRRWAMIVREGLETLLAEGPSK